MLRIGIRISFTVEERRDDLSIRELWHYYERGSRGMQSCGI